MDNDLTYKIIGFSYKVYNEFGYGHKEKIYQSAIEKLFKITN